MLEMSDYRVASCISIGYLILDAVIIVKTIIGNQSSRVSICTLTTSFEHRTIEPTGKLKRAPSEKSEWGSINQNVNFILNFKEYFII